MIKNRNKSKQQEIYILATEVYPFGKSQPSLYSDILALFDTLEEAEEVRQKLERGEKVDFIDMSVVADYDRLIIFNLPLNENIGTKLAIFVSGGLISGIISNKTLLDPIVIDYDTEGVDSNSPDLIVWSWRNKDRISEQEHEGVVLEPEFEVNSTFTNYLYDLYYRKEND